jgi:hypothetical protein
MLPVRSFRRGQVTADEVRGLLPLLRDGGEYKSEEIIAGMAEIDSYAGDILIADGDLHVAGDLDLYRGRSQPGS